MADFILFQSRSFLAFFGCGLCAAAFFDLMRIFRKLLTHNTFFTALEDLLFWLFTGASCFALLYHFQSGKLRFFLLFGFLAGMAIWLRTCSRLFMGPICRLLLCLKKLLQKLYDRIYKKWK